MASSSFMFLVLLVSVTCCSANYFDPIRHSRRPWIYFIDEGITDTYRPPLSEPWIPVHQHRLIQTLADTPGLKIASAILQQCHLNRLLLVDVVHEYRNGTVLFVPNCDAITIYINPLENEMEILENYPGIIDDIASGRRVVKAQLDKKVERFDAGGNVSVSHPFVYSDEERVVVVHGTSGGFGAVESQISNLSLYGPHPFVDDRGNGVSLGGAGGFKVLEYPLWEGEKEFINRKKMKVEMVIVANIVPTPESVDYDPDSVEWYILSTMYGSPERAIARRKRGNMPYRITMIYTMHF